MGQSCSAISCGGCKAGSCNCHEFDTVEVRAEKYEMFSAKKSETYKRDEFIEWLRQRVTQEVEMLNMQNLPSDISNRTGEEANGQINFGASASFYNGSFASQSR